ncbi:MAG: hypothetical protein HY905_01040 [Deltaproteobacteria bacterium]|nr:hypothetical protein [Deltaproteobacteria bacterium]
MATPRHPRRACRGPASRPSAAAPRRYQRSTARPLDRSPPLPARRARADRARGVIAAQVERADADAGARARAGRDRPALRQPRDAVRDVSGAPDVLHAELDVRIAATAVVHVRALGRRHARAPAGPGHAGNLALGAHGRRREADHGRVVAVVARRATARGTGHVGGVDSPCGTGGDEALGDTARRRRLAGSESQAVAAVRVQRALPRARALRRRRSPAVRIRVGIGVGIGVRVRVPVRVGIGVRIRVPVPVRIAIRVRIPVRVRTRFGFRLGVRLFGRIRVRIRGDFAGRVPLFRARIAGDVRTPAVVRAAEDGREQSRGAPPPQHHASHRLPPSEVRRPPGAAEGTGSKPNTPSPPGQSACSGRGRDEPEEVREHSYDDGPLPIGWDQTISQPYILAIMTQLAEVAPGERVLEIGTGSGYQAAVLAELGADVYTIEIVGALAERALCLFAPLARDGRLAPGCGEARAR